MKVFAGGPQDMSDAAMPFRSLGQSLDVALVKRLAKGYWARCRGESAQVNWH